MTYPEAKVTCSQIDLLLIIIIIQPSFILFIWFYTYIYATGYLVIWFHLSSLLKETNESNDRFASEKKGKPKNRKKNKNKIGWVRILNGYDCICAWADMLWCTQTKINYIQLESVFIQLKSDFFSIHSMWNIFLSGKKINNFSLLPLFSPFAANGTLCVCVRLTIDNMQSTLDNNNNAGYVEPDDQKWKREAKRKKKKKKPFMIIGFAKPIQLNANYLAIIFVSEFRSCLFPIAERNHFEYNQIKIINPKA